MTLTGECSTWQTVINVGHAVAHVEGVRNVVCEMTAKGVTIPHKDYTPYVQAGQARGVVDEADVVVVGAGITGCGVAGNCANMISGSSWWTWATTWPQAAASPTTAVFITAWTASRERSKLNSM